jgi:outer membrane protein assembly factor BamB
MMTSCKTCRCLQTISRSLLLLVVIILPICASACQSTPRKQLPAPAVTPSNREARQEAIRVELEEKYTVGPISAAKIDYKVNWQFPIPHEKVSQLISSGEYFFILTHDNDLICVRTHDGLRVWTVSVGKPLDEVESILPIETDGLVVVLKPSSINTLNISTGMAEKVTIGKATQNLEWVANTPGVLDGEHLLYGARSGQLVWQAWRIGFPWRAYQVDHGLKLAPILSGDIALVTGSSGIVMAFNARNASQLWKKKLLDSVTADPVASSDTAYIAGLDQHLRAFDLSTGNTRWRVLTNTPLVDSPVLIGDRVYQQIPGQGLAAFAARPANDFNGHQYWLNKDISGNVLTRHGSSLVVWDSANHVLGTISSSQGTSDTLLHVPDVVQVIADDLENGTLFALGYDGRLTCLTPSN